MTGIRLPTCRQVLRCLMYYIGEAVIEKRPGCTSAPPKWESSKCVLSQVTTFYQKANIPTVSDHQACMKMVKLLDANAKLREIPVARRSTPATLRKLHDMQQQLDATFAIWPANAAQLIRNAEDRAFLESMQGDRAASFGAFDKLLSCRVKRRQARDERAAERQSQHTASGSSAATAEETVSSEDDEHIETVPHHTPKRVHRRTTRPGTAAFFPHNILRSPKLVSLATRLKMTPTQQATFTKAIIEEAGGDPDKVSTSYATADRTRRKVGEAIAQQCRDDWTPPALASLHWDSKLMPSLTNRNISEERLTVVVGTADKLKLLGVPSYMPGTDKGCGKIISELTVKLLDTWHCTGAVVNMVFDTTASNTGHISAACISIQSRVGRALLWSGCRHHVGEVILSHVFDDLRIETSKSPEVALFARYRTNFELMPHSSNQALSRFDVHELPPAGEDLLRECRDDILQLAARTVEYQRDDYREFAQLCVIYLNADSPPVQLKRPGAMHKARWMSKLLYAIKICLSEQQIKQLPPGTVTTRQQVSKLRQFVVFVTHVYSSWWMTCTSVVDAPWRDLCLVHLLLRYETCVDALVGRSALRAFQRHFWYLTAEMVPLALFSENVPEQVRRELAEKLLDVQPDTLPHFPQHRFGTEFGKPQFPQIDQTTTLAGLAGPDSWFLFNQLRLDAAFLQLAVADWASSAAYQQCVRHIKAINVTNDCAERGVKLSADYLASARSEQHLQNVLQVVEGDRKRAPNLRSRKRIADNL